MKTSGGDGAQSHPCLPCSWHANYGDRCLAASEFRGDFLLVSGFERENSKRATLDFVIFI
jgi:hypothetical protein